jgi:hypothetical protein
MRVAVLILASHTPRALFALATYFAPSDVDIFVHLDARIDAADYLAQTPPYPPRVTFLDARRRVFWGGFSMVEATLDLLRAAVRAGPYDCYVFISDNSLPVQSLDGFFATLGAKPDIIEAWKLPDPDSRRCYDNFYMMDDDVYDVRRHWLWPAPVDAAMEDKFRRVLALKARGKKPTALFRGQASWALSPDSVRLVLDAFDNDSWWVESCRFAFATDEVAFATLVANAKYPEGLDDPPTYSDQFRFFPRVIRTALDLPFDMHPHFLFVRKIAPDFIEGLPETCLRIYGGVRHMLALDPLARSESVIAISEAGAPHLHLFAPIAEDPAWGPRAIHHGRRSRNLNAGAWAWRLRAPATWRELRLTLPCVFGKSDAILPDAAFEINGQRAALEVCDIGYRAQFRDLAQPFDRITLHLPDGERPDLCVAVMPEG